MTSDGRADLPSASDDDEPRLGIAWPERSRLGRCHAGRHRGRYIPLVAEGRHEWWQLHLSGSWWEDASTQHLHGNAGIRDLDRPWPVEWLVPSDEEAAPEVAPCDLREDLVGVPLTPQSRVAQGRARVLSSCGAD